MRLETFVTNARPHRRAPLALLLAAVALTACIDSDVPEIVEPGDPPALMERYVSLGNSITAGLQSGGLHEGLQVQAYPVLLAAKADAPFTIPAIAEPGCPVPMVAPLTPDPEYEAGFCAGRVLPAPAEINNLAVPGAAVADLDDPMFISGGLGTLLLGGQTQLGRMASMDPTLVSAWIGNMDALIAASLGDTLFVHPVTGDRGKPLTPLADFQAAYDDVVAAIDETGADAILIGVVDAIQYAPILQPGAYFWAIAQQDTSLTVSDNCAPGQPGGARMVSFAALANLPAVDCSAEAMFVLNETEIGVFMQRVAAYNAYIEAQADANGWIYVDPTDDLIGAAALDPDNFRKCQWLNPAHPDFSADPADFPAAIQNSCPGPTAPGFFGAFVSLDGVHPSTHAHEVVADRLAAILNEERGLSLPVGQ